MRNVWDDRFDSDDYLFGKKPAQALVRHAPQLIQGGKTLVVADGEGRNSCYLAGLGFDVYANDYSSVALAKAKDLAAEQQVNVTFAMADIYDFDWAQQAYDNVVAIFIQFVPPAERAKIFAGLKQALRSGGMLFLHGYTPQQVAYGTGGPSNPDHMYTNDMLSDAFGDMDVILQQSYEAELDEGHGHSGKSALIDLVAKKN